MTRGEWCDVAGDDELLFLDEPFYDSCIVGVGPRNGVQIVVYDIDKMVNAYMQANECQPEDAWEWLDFNTFNAWVGERTPMYIDGGIK